MFETAQEYFKLERTELAGLKGRTLCARIYDIYEEFVKAYNEFAELQYDILMPEETRFTDHVASFLAKVRRLAMIIARVIEYVSRLSTVRHTPLPRNPRKTRV